jgi:hypothetical protein
MIMSYPTNALIPPDQILLSSLQEPQVSTPFSAHTVERSSQANSNIILQGHAYQ